MTSHLDGDNCVGMYQFADRYNLSRLMKRARDVVLSKFPYVSRQVEFLRLDEETLVDFISSDDLHVTSEDLVYDAVVRWILKPGQAQYSAPQRVLAHVRFPFMKSSTLLHICRAYPFIEWRDCLNYVIDALAFKQDPAEVHVVAEPMYRKRTFYEDVDTFYIIAGVDNAKEVQTAIYSSDAFDRGTTKEWKKTSNCMPYNLWRFGWCSSGRYIYTTGGERAHEQQQTCLMYDTLSGTFSFFTELPFGMSSHACAKVKDCIYLIGGHVETEPFVTDRVMQYKSVTKHDGEWRSVAPLPTSTKRSLAIGFHGKLYVFGGIDCNDIDTVRCFCYDPTMNEWFMLSDMPLAPRCAACVVINKDIYVIGGYGRHCLKYIPATDTWYTRSRPNHQRGLCAAAAYNSRIYLTGGRDEFGETTDTIEIYDPVANNWCDSQVVLHMPLFGHCLCCVSSC